MIFQRGDEVEIMSKEEGFDGSFYSATVVSQISKTEYIIQYKTLLEDDEYGPLGQAHSLDEIRPMPPEIQVTEFRMHDVVDAYDGDGWWSASITGQRDSKYTVCFHTTEEEMSFTLENLRVHQDWVNGKWVRSNSKGKDFNKRN